MRHRIGFPAGLFAVALACEAGSGTSSSSLGPTTMPSEESGGEASSTASDGETGVAEGGMPIAPENLIDDFEDGDDEIVAGDARSGSWYAFNDGTMGGMQTPPADGAFAPTEGGPEGSTFYAHTTGSGFAEWGAGIGCDLNGSETETGPKGTYDASGHTGIALLARGNVSITVDLVIDGVLAEALGGTCTGTEGDCDDTHFKAIALDDTWRQYLIPFAEVAQEGWGQPVAFDPARLVGIQLGIPAGSEFDVAIDEVGFY